MTKELYSTPGAACIDGLSDGTHWIELKTGSNL